MQLFCSPPKHNDGHGPHYYDANETDLSNKKRVDHFERHHTIHPYAPKKKKKNTQDQNSVATEK